MNRILKVSKYMLHETTKPILVFYGVMLFLYAFWVGMPILYPGSNVEFNGLEASTAVFLLVTGLVSFKSNYLFMQANGVTRRLYYAGGLLGLAGITVLLTVVDAIIGGILGGLLDTGRGLPPLLYPGSGFAGSFLWTLAINLLAVCTGWFITMLYFCSGKWIKLLISLSPILVLIVLKFIDNMTGGIASKLLGTSIQAAMGFAGEPNIFLGAFTMLVMACAAAGLCYLLVRRAPVKEQDRDR